MCHNMQQIRSAFYIMYSLKYFLTSVNSNGEFNLVATEVITPEIPKNPVPKLKTNKTKAQLHTVTLHTVIG